jgi:hypothetical protein
MIDKASSQDWARSVVEANPGSLNDPDGYLAHLRQVQNLAEIVVGNILEANPGIPLITKEISVAAGLHDIGMPRLKKKVFHGLEGARYIEQEGLERGVADSLKDVYRIAQMLRSHGFAPEYWQEPEFAGLRKEFEPLNTALLVPRTWQEVIVTYADMTNLGGERVTMEERIAESLERYSNDHRYADAKIVKVTKVAQPRMLQLARRVEALEQGELTTPEIFQYGFL